MDKVEHRITQGGPYYSHGEVDCFECWAPGKILANISGGEYQRVDHLTIAEIGFLLEVARGHMHEKQGHHPVIFEFRAGLGESEQWKEIFEKRKYERKG